MTVVLTTPASADHDPGEGHPERPGRIPAVLAEMEIGKVPVTRVEWTRAATRLEMERVHARAMLDAVESLSARGGGRVDADTVVSAGSWRAATLAAGAAVEAARLALGGERAFVVARPPGHHATPTRAMGFCLVNSVAVAAEAALAAGARRVAVFDHDVHHGNGTQDAFYSRGDVLYVSTHQSPLYPGTGFQEETGAGAGKGATLNIPMPPGTGEAEYAGAFERVVLPRLAAFQPDVLLVSAGFDCHHRDPLAHFRLTAPFFHRIHRQLTERVTGNVAAVLEGGYDLVGLARSAAATAAALAGAPCPSWPDEALPAESSRFRPRGDAASEMGR